MLKYIKKHWMWCVICPLFMVGEIAMSLLQPSMMTQIVDKGVLEQNMELIFAVGTKMILLVVLGGLCGIASSISAHVASQLFGNDLRKDLFSRIMGLSFQQTDAFTTGSLVTRLTNDVTQLQSTVAFAVRMLLRSVLLFAGSIYMLYLNSPSFSLVCGVLLPVVLVVCILFLKKVSPLYGKVQDRLDAINSFLQEHIAAARVVKAYVNEEYEMSRFSAANDELCRVNLTVQILLAFMRPCMNILLNLGMVFIIYLGNISVQAGTGVTPGQIMGSLTYMTMILSRMVMLSNVFQNFTRGAASWKRVKEVLDSPEVLADGSGSGEAGKTGEVEFRDVSFAYPGSSDREVLKHISFRVRRGETLAIIGATGSGKSTLVHLIPRFYDVTEGSVLVDGVDVREYSQSALREKIATVFQTAQLYSRSIEENIRWGVPEADPWQIKQAAQTAQADDFICAAENGYYTQVTESGHSLSGGQKQRLAIARAVLKRPEILIFDDSSSALDLKTEAALHDALREEFGDATQIIVAQRIASVRRADRILVLENGEISAQGTHAQLLERSPLYREICDSQLKGGDENG